MLTNVMVHMFFSGLESMSQSRWCGKRCSMAQAQAGTEQHCMHGC